MSPVSFGSSAGESLPKVTDAHFQGKQEVVWTVESARFVNFTDQRSGQVTERTLFVAFLECPGHELKCNRTMGAGFQKLMMAGKLPNQADGAGNPLWRGCLVPLELRGYRNPAGGPDVSKPTPVHPDLFDTRAHAYRMALLGGVPSSVPTHSQLSGGPFHVPVSPNAPASIPVKPHRPPAKKSTPAKKGKK